jgi:hypothetical protein
MYLSRMLLTTAALGAAAIAPSAAQAAEGFTAVTSDGRLAHFHSDSRPGLSAPVKVVGLAAGERIVGLDRARSGELLALTSAGNIDVLDDKTGKATPKFPAPVTSPVAPAAPLTFAVAPDGTSARIITTGRDVSVNLATGAGTAGPGVTFAPTDAHAGAPATPALDYAADGRLIGLAGAQGVYAAETAPGAGTLNTLTAAPFPALEPLRTTIASDGSVWAAANFSTNANRPKQSRVVRYDPATGRISGQRGVFFLSQFAALADDGPVADDTTAPEATISGRVLQRHVARGGSHYGGLRVKVDEGGQTLASVRLRGKVVGFALATAETAGTYALEFGAGGRNAVALRRAAAAHRRVTVHLAVHDWAHNLKTYDRVMRLSG